jgi:hypothetical protein
MMRAKSKRQPLRLDLQADFAAHVEEEKARRWLKKAMVLEARVPGTPHSGGRG